MKHVRGVGFDLFNTLVTLDAGALPEAEQRLTEFLLASGVPIQREAFLESHRNWARSFLEATRADGRETHNRYWIAAALEDSGCGIRPEHPVVEAAVEAYFSSFVERCRLIPGTVEMLRNLSSSYRIGLLSNFTHGPAARRILESTGLAECFRVVVISGEFGFRKPHRRVFDRLVNELEISSGETVYVGDDPEPDITGALDAGLRPVWTTYVRDRGLTYAPGYMSRCEEEDYRVPRISDWGELEDLLGRGARF